MVLVMLSASPAALSKPPTHSHSIQATPVVSRLPLPLRQLLFRKFMNAIQQAAEDGEKKYPMPHAEGRPYQKMPQWETPRHTDTRTRYTSKLTERYCGAIQRQYGVTSHEEDLIESEAAAKGWHD